MVGGKPNGAPRRDNKKQPKKSGKDDGKYIEKGRDKS